MKNDSLPSKRSLAAAIGTIGFLPLWLAPLNQVWMLFAELLHRVVNPINLSEPIVYTSEDALHCVITTDIVSRCIEVSC